MKKIRYWRTLSVALIAVLLFTGFGVFITLQVTASEPEGTYVVVSTPSTNTTLSAKTLTGRGHRVVDNMSKMGIMVVRTNKSADLKKTYGAGNVFRDRVGFRIPKEERKPVKRPVAEELTGCAAQEPFCPKQWEYERINLKKAWETTQGNARVRVALLDSGYNPTHEASAENYDSAASRSFSQATTSCPEEKDLTSTQDAFDHGTWVGNRIAGKTTAQVTGIAPKVTLINVRVGNVCGEVYWSWALKGMQHAYESGAQIINMSINGFICADGTVPESFYCGSSPNPSSDPAFENDPAIWNAYQQMVSFLRERGTLVIAAAGNEHVQVDSEGRVTSVGSLTTKNDPANDFRGTRLIPGGLPGVITVAATNRVNAPGPDSETKYGRYGVGLKDQLAYYSSYGERIDVAAPGGSRNFNIAKGECITTECSRTGPSTPETNDNPASYGPSMVDADGNLCNTCYSYKLGTSMATPTVTGVAALMLSARPYLARNPELFVRLLKKSVTPFTDANATPPIESDPSKPTFNYSMAYGAPGIPNTEMGTGIIDAAKAVNRFSR